MLDPRISGLGWVVGLVRDPPPQAFSGWFVRPEFQYPLAFGCLILLGLLVYRMPDILAWRRGLHREIVLPIELEMQIIGTPMVIVDLRPPAEFNGPRGHLRGAVNVPMDLLPRRIGQLAPDKRHLVILVDANDVLSHRAAVAFKAAGYTWVRVLRGGMRAWRAKGLPVAVTGRG